MAWLAGYSYRKKITIKGETGAETDYQVSLSVGDASGGDFHLESHCTDFPNDIRFTDNDGETELSYWIKDAAADPIEVWIKVTDDLDSNVDIYVYYGKSGDSTASNGVNTFIFFDNFNDNSLDTDKWDKRIELGTITEEDSVLKCEDGATSGDYGHTALDSKSMTDFRTGIIEGSLYLSADAIAEFGFRGGADNTGYKARFDARANQGIGNLKPPYASWDFLGDGGSTGVAVGNSEWLPFKITVYDNGTTCTMISACDGQSNTSTDNDYATQSGRISLQNHYGSYAHYNDVRVRKYAATEPDFSAADSEEEAPSGFVGHGAHAFSLT